MSTNRLHEIRISKNIRTNRNDSFFNTEIAERLKGRKGRNELNERNERKFEAVRIPRFPPFRVFRVKNIHCVKNTSPQSML
ncbi:MAG: hypothetical protein LBQ66_02030 [Planctomycetaceae bacterium]|jgi:hypothetical protein|nr:hypothetical protein [Planctomycetaceae bacterium]